MTLIVPNRTQSHRRILAWDVDAAAASGRDGVRCAVARDDRTAVGGNGRNRIRRDLRVDIPIARFLGGATIDGLTADLLEHLALSRMAAATAASVDQAEEFVL